ALKARREAAEDALLVRREGRARRVGDERFLAREPLLGVERGRRALLGRTPRDGAVDPAQGIDRLDRVVRPEGERRAGVEERAPRIAGATPLLAEAPTGDLDVAREMHRLDARDDAEDAAAPEVRGAEDLRVLDPVPRGAEARAVVVGRAQRREGIERERDGPVADRVEPDLKA